MKSYNHTKGNHPNSSRNARSNIRDGEIWLANLPFSNGVDSKERPVLILQQGPGLVCYKCTTKVTDQRRRYEVLFLEEAGLEHDTYIDTEPIRISSADLRHRMGVLAPEDLEGFRQCLRG